jgi:hypothetical protein
MGSMAMGSQNYNAVWFDFTNDTGSVVYIRHVKLSRCSKRMGVAIQAAKNIGFPTHELKFFTNFFPTEKLSSKLGGLRKRR